MAIPPTLLAMRTQIRQRADIVNSLFIVDAELTSYVNASAQALYDLIIQKFGDEYYFTTYAFTTIGGQETYSLPADFYKLLGVDLALNGNNFVTVRPYMLSERNVYRATNYQGTSADEMRYRLLGQTLSLLPAPNVGYAGQLLYIPQMTPLVLDTDTLPVIAGWEEFVITDCVIKCNQKEETDSSVAERQKAQLIERLENAAENRDAGAPQRVTDVFATSNPYMR